MSLKGTSLNEYMTKNTDIPSLDSLVPHSAACEEGDVILIGDKLSGNGSKRHGFVGQTHAGDHS